MQLYDSIFARKSIRKFNKKNLSSEQQVLVMDFAEKAIPLYPDIKTRIIIAPSSEVNTMMAVKSPQYLLIYSEKKEGDLLNAGLILQQIDLFLSSQGIGSCWLGLTKPKATSLDGLEFVIMLAIGMPQEPVHRESIEDFRRKSLSEISNGADARLEAARLAPSSRNGQPWYFLCEEGNINIYRKKPAGLLNSVFDRLTQIDLGITLSHIMLSGEKIGKAFSFDDNIGLSEMEGFLPVGVVRG